MASLIPGDGKRETKYFWFGKQPRPHLPMRNRRGLTNFRESDKGVLCNCNFVLKRKLTDSGNTLGRFECSEKVDIVGMPKSCRELRRIIFGDGRKTDWVSLLRPIVGWPWNFYQKQIMWIKFWSSYALRCCKLGFSVFAMTLVRRRLFTWTRSLVDCFLDYISFGWLLHIVGTF